MKTTAQSKTRTLTECAILLAMSFALSYVKLFRMPMGGSITLASMLPVLFVGIKHGSRWGFGTAFVYSLTQLFQALMSGDVFVWCETWDIWLLCALFDYILPFTLLGLSSMFKTSRLNLYLGVSLTITLRFACHYVSGVLIWGQWAENMSPYLYSFLYNGALLLPELLICLVVLVPLLEVKQVRRLLGITHEHFN